MMVATLTNRAVTAILVVSANQNTSSGDMVRKFCAIKSGNYVLRNGFNGYLAQHNFATGMRHLGQKQTFGVVRSRPGNGRFDAGTVQTCLPLRFVASLSLGVVTSANVASVIQGDFLMQFSSAIRAALIALTVTGAGLTTVYADFGGIRFNVIKAGFVVGGSGGSG